MVFNIARPDPFGQDQLEHNLLGCVCVCVCVCEREREREGRRERKRELNWIEFWEIHQKRIYIWWVTSLEKGETRVELREKRAESDAGQ